jgi:hypothetical protein
VPISRASALLRTIGNRLDRRRNSSLGLRERAAGRVRPSRRATACALPRDPLDSCQALVPPGGELRHLALRLGETFVAHGEAGFASRAVCADEIGALKDREVLGGAPSGDCITAAGGMGLRRGSETSEATPGASSRSPASQMQTISGTPCWPGLAHVQRAGVCAATLSADPPEHVWGRITPGDFADPVDASSRSEGHSRPLSER